jgi:hypothetical protein
MTRLFFVRSRISISSFLGRVFRPAGRLSTPTFMALFDLMVDGTTGGLLYYWFFLSLLAGAVLFSSFLLGLA